VSLHNDCTFNSSSSIFPEVQRSILSKNKLKLVELNSAQSDRRQTPCAMFTWVWPMVVASKLLYYNWLTTTGTTTILQHWHSRLTITGFISSSFTASVPLLTETSTSEMEQKKDARVLSPHWCYLHHLHTLELHMAKWRVFHTEWKSDNNSIHCHKSTAECW